MRDFHLPGRSAVYAENGLCATSHPLAAKVAIQMLEAGGNAVDAAIAGAVLLGLAEPQMTGIGGDMFALVQMPDGSVKALNGSGRAPAGLSADTLRAEGLSAMPDRGAASVTLPGAVVGFCRLSKDLGRLGIATSLAPAIHYARAGIPVAPRVALDWGSDAGRLSETAAKTYLTGGEAPSAGTIFRAPKLANVLTHIATEGRAGFYEGEVAEDMVQSLQALGGTHTLEDFASVTADYVEPISGQYGNYQLVEHPPNGQGAAAILLARILAEFDIASLDPLGAERAHLEAEATKLAYGARDQIIADAAHVTELERMLDGSLAQELAAQIRRDAVLPTPVRAGGMPHKDTIYITVVDKDRMAVSLIYSIFASFGSGLASEKFGVLFHNRGAGFCLTPGHPNEAGPGKRPLHTIIPGLLRQDGALTHAFGVMGGPYQPTGHARFLSNTADFGMDPQAAIDAPRSFAWGGQLQVERGYSEATRQSLADLGHVVIVPDKPIGGAQAIRIDAERGILIGGSDPRKDGCALGY
ncbi:gamma-glutamyltransferase family protein [Palleronia caenipelagi]|uniref:Gamma-glutamyltransferase family protein n=1 Tax=Palleronia caenipelagi TaxID=2489174 RepID=A0A547PNC8_9RHOB|nr:gamma-glutamyltransferase family protein [Palleronia caenipelagi]TRD15629.1 gamma-glutamyltransferase family protein [Palleronia caenipelagi]